MEIYAAAMNILHVVLGHTSFLVFCYYSNCVTLILYVQRIVSDKKKR